MTRKILKSYEDTIISVTIAKVECKNDKFYVVEYYSAYQDENYSSKLNYVTFTEENREHAHAYFRKLVTNAMS